MCKRGIVLACVGQILNKNLDSSQFSVRLFPKEPTIGLILAQHDIYFEGICSIKTKLL
jgi:hypothetical protein